MPEYVIRLAGFVGGHHPRVGQYVVAFDPTIQPDGSVLLETTSDPLQAARYADIAAALELWRAVSPNRPVRGDGRPNRPMTVFTAELVPLARAIPGDRRQWRAPESG